MREPRNLAVTLPSPSEMDNYHRCPCLWYLKDRMWVKSRDERWPLMFGRIIDDVCGRWLMKDLTEAIDAVAMYLQEVGKIRPDQTDDYFEAYAASAKDALNMWLKVYGKISQEENVLVIQPKWKTNVNVKIDYAIRGITGIRVRERKLITGWADIEEEVAKYEMGFQPICYAEMAAEFFKEPIECVELEFLIRSLPAKGKYKAKPARTERREIFVEAWKKDLWYNSALFTNECMKMLEESMEGEKEEVDFAAIPRHTRNCLQKIGHKMYPCDFYNYCKTNTNPITVPEMFTCDRLEEADALKRCTKGSGI